MVRAVLEGVAFGLADSLDLIRGRISADLTQMRVSGGGAKSNLWRQIMADVFGVELVTVNVTEGVAYGAALLAGVGSGVWADAQTACDATIKITSSTAPRMDVHEAYKKGHALYRELYPALKPTFDAVAEK